MMYCNLTAYRPAVKITQQDFKLEMNCPTCHGFQQVSLAFCDRVGCCDLWWTSDEE
jgi:hypothetical protein